MKADGRQQKAAGWRLFFFAPPVVELELPARSSLCSGRQGDCYHHHHHRRRPALAQSRLVTAAAVAAEVMIRLDRCAAPQSRVSGVGYGGSGDCLRSADLKVKDPQNVVLRACVCVCVCWGALSAPVSVAKPSIKLLWQPSVHQPIHHPRATDGATERGERRHGRVER